MQAGAEGDEVEWGLVDRAQAGDREAFGRLFHLHHPAIYRVARARLPHALAEDATAETFARAWKGLPGYTRTGAPFAAWLYGIARHVVADMVKVAARTQCDADLPERASDPWVASDDRLRLHQAIAELPAEQRRVIELKYLMGFSNDEVAAAMGKKPGAVNTQQWRALRALERSLKSR